MLKLAKEEIAEIVLSEPGTLAMAWPASGGLAECPDAIHDLHCAEMRSFLKG
jgi:hypothetical protein